MDKNETEEGLQRRAYALGLKLKNSGLDMEVIYARLEKQGIPEELAQQVVEDIMMERQKTETEDKKSFHKVALLSIGVGVIAAIVSMIVIPGTIIIPFGLIIGGIVVAFITNEK